MTFKLGKKPKRIDARTFKLSRYLATLPPVPSAIDWGGKVPTWGMMLNDSLGDCTCAGAGHLEMLWTSQASTEFVPSDPEILAAYEAVSGYTPTNPASDQGADMLTVLNYWRATGIAGQRIYAFAELGLNNQQQLMAAIAFFGGVYAGVNLPESALDATENGQEWTNATDQNIAGGHCIPLIAYDQNTVKCVTWGQEQTMTWAWLNAYADELYAVLSPEFIGANGSAPSGFNMLQLSGDLASL